MKRAGDVKGTPDWQLDQMIELDRDLAWQEQNKEVKAEITLRDALPDLEIAIDTLRGAIHSLNGAYMLLQETPTGDKIVSVMDGLEDTLCDIKTLRDICEGRQGR